MKYKIEPEILGDSTLKLDGGLCENLYPDVCKTISEFTGIDLSKVVHFVNKLGLKNFFLSPAVMGISKEQEMSLRDLENLIQFGAENVYETNVYHESV